jgi:hypothetical protein
MQEIGVSKNITGPITLRSSHSVFAIALLSSLALHAALVGVRPPPAHGNEPASIPITASLVGTWNTRLLKPPPPSAPTLSGGRRSSNEAALPPHQTKSNTQELKYTNEQSHSDIRFYLFNEVETPATPINDWISTQDSRANIDNLQSVIFRIWILETGEVQDVSILRTIPTNLNDGLKTTLIESIKRTQARPAFRDGGPVASERTIEMIFDSGLQNRAHSPDSGTVQF